MFPFTVKSNIFLNISPLVLNEEDISVMLELVLMRTRGQQVSHPSTVKQKELYLNTTVAASGGGQSHCLDPFLSIQKNALKFMLVWILDILVLKGIPDLFHRGLLIGKHQTTPHHTNGPGELWQGGCFHPPNAVVSLEQEPDMSHDSLGNVF